MRAIKSPVWTPGLPVAVWIQQRCLPTMDTLEQILENHLSRCSLSVEMINDILARWGGLRPLINICSAFDGKWQVAHQLSRT
jgi:hypothetical protein